MRSRKNNARVCKSKVKKGVNIDRLEKRMVKNKEVRKWGMMIINIKRGAMINNIKSVMISIINKDRKGIVREMLNVIGEVGESLKSGKMLREGNGRGRSIIAIVNICGAIFNEIDFFDMIFLMMMKMILDGLLLGVDVNGMIMINFDFNG